MLRRALSAALVALLALAMAASPCGALDCRIQAKGLENDDIFTSVRCDGFRKFEQKTPIKYAQEMLLESGVRLFGKLGKHGVGIVLLQHSEINIVDSHFEDLPAEVRAGPILAPLVLANSASSVSNSTFSKQGTGLIAGGVYVTDNSNVLLSGCALTGNVGASVGGLSVDGSSTVAVEGCTFDRNAAPGWAGSVQVGGSSDVEISNSTFMGTHAPPSVDQVSELKLSLAGHFRDDDLPNAKVTLLPVAGAVYATGGSRMTVRDTNFHGYSGQRGTMHVTGKSTVELLRTSFTDNFVKEGAGLYLGDADAVVESTNFTTNMATTGGAVAVVGQGSLSMKACGFRENTAIEDGGALFVDSSLPGGCPKVGAVLTLEGSVFASNDAKGSGGALRSLCSGSIDIKEITFAENSAGGNGGGVHVSNGGDVSVHSSSFAGNKGTVGGGLFIEEAPRVSFDSVSCQSNTAFGDLGGGAGAMLVGVGVVTVVDSVFEYNFAQGDGSALAVYDAAMATISSTQFQFNQADGSGGGVAASTVDLLRMDNVSFHDNVATNNGGGLQADGVGTVQLTASNFSDNQARAQGGALSLSSAEPDLTIDASKCEFLGNRAQTGGGAMHLQGAKTARLSASTCTSNVAFGSGAAGGCILTSGLADVSIEDCRFMSNSANSTGGGVHHQGGRLVLTALAMEANEAGVQGGAVASVQDSGVEVSNCRFRQNSAPRGGALNFDESERVDIVDADFAENSAGTLGPLTSNAPEMKASAGVGGAVRATGVKTMDMTNSSFDMNAGDVLGGAVHAEGGYVTMSAVNFTQNACGGLGGALSLVDVLQATLHNGSFKGNQAHAGAGVVVKGESIMNGSHLTFESNAAGTSGSAVQCHGNATISVGFSDFSKDTAAYGNGLVAACNCTMSILNSTLTGEEPFYMNVSDGNNTCVSTVKTHATQFFFNATLDKVKIVEKQRNDEYGLIAYFGEDQSMVKTLGPAGPPISQKQAEISTAVYVTIAVGIFIAVLLVLVGMVALGKWVADAPKYEEFSDSEDGDVETKGLLDKPLAAPLLQGSGNLEDSVTSPQAPFSAGETSISIDQEPAANPNDFGQSTEDYVRDSEGVKLSYTPEPLVQSSETPVPGPNPIPPLFGTSQKDDEIQEV